MKGIDMFSFLA